MNFFIYFNSEIISIRIYKYQLVIKKSKALFSERNGYHKYHKIIGTNWRFTFFNLPRMTK